MSARAIAIVGGGISGLSAAYFLERRLGMQEPAARIALLEAAERVGGVIRTVRDDGFVIDAGPDSLLTEPPTALELCRELGLEDEFLDVPAVDRRVWVYTRRRLRPLPSALAFVLPQDSWALVRSGILSWRGLLRAGVEPFIPEGSDRGDESLGEFFGRRLGREAVERIIEPLLAGIYAGDVDRLSAAATVPRLREMVRRHGSLLRGMRKARARGADASLSGSAGPTGGAGRVGAGGGGGTASGAGVGSGGSLFVGLARGLESLVDRLRAALRHTEIRTRARVSRIDGSASGGYDVLEERSGSLGRFDAVVLAAPATRAAEMVRALDAELAAALGEILYVSTATVFLAYDRRDLPAVPAGHGFFIPRVERRTVRGATFVSNKYPGRAPAEQFLLRAFVGGAGREEIVGREDSEIVGAVRADLADVLGWTAEPRFARVFRYEGANPQYEVGHLERVARIERAAARHRGLAVAGNAYRGLGISGCIAEARRAAERVVAEIAGPT